ncbi:hypothetical protein PENTCL1PPCAC_19568, partial [Pristionchus entomophagus]
SGMSQDPGEELVEGLDKMEEVLSLDQFDPPNEAGSEIGKELRDYFNLLGLPIELISHSFSFLSMEDRLRAAGVNKRLKGIELASKYYVERVLIEEAEEIPKEIKEWMMMMRNAVDGDDGDDNEEDLDFYDVKISQRITFHKGKSYSSDCIRRIAQNASIKILEIQLYGSEEFHRDIFNLIKEFDGIKYLEVGIKGKDKEMLREMMVDSYLLGLTKSCKFLYLNVSESVSEKVTPDALHQLCKDMTDGSTNFCNLAINSLRKDRCIELLKLVGIIYRDDTFFSSKEIEVYERRAPDDSVRSYSIIDGAIEFMINCDIFECAYGGFIICLHKTRDSLKEVRNREGYFRIDISPE